MALSSLPTMPGLTFPVLRQPQWDTDQQISISGKKTGFARRNSPLWHYELGYSLLRSNNGFAELQTIAAFYNSCYGKATPFLYADPDDGTATAASFGLGDSSSTAFQLYRTFGGFVEPVFAPTGVPQIYVAGVLKTLGTDYTIGATGIVTFATPPVFGAALTWTGVFSWVCYFDDDTVDFSKFMDGMWEAKKLAFTTTLL